MSISLGNCINEFTISIVIFVALAIVFISAKLKAKDNIFTEEQRKAQGTGYKIGAWIMIAYFVLNSTYCSAYGNWFDTLNMNIIGVCIGVLSCFSYMIFTNSFVSPKEKPLNRAFRMFIPLLLFVGLIFTEINTNNTLTPEAISCIIIAATVAILCAELTVKTLCTSTKNK